MKPKRNRMWQLADTTNYFVKEMTFSNSPWKTFQEHIHQQISNLILPTMSKRTNFVGFFYLMKWTSNFSPINLKYPLHHVFMLLAWLRLIIISNITPQFRLKVVWLDCLRWSSILSSSSQFQRNANVSQELHKTRLIIHAVTVCYSLMMTFLIKIIRLTL